MTQKKYKLTVVIGRFQPLHDEHVNLIEHAVSLGEQTLVLVGSADEARSYRNPFTFAERKACIQECFPDVIIMPVFDFTYNPDKWIENVKFLIRNTDPYPMGNEVALVGHYKDDTDYLGWFDGHAYESYKSNDATICSTTIRDDWFSRYESHVNIFWAKSLPVPLATKRLLLNSCFEQWSVNLSLENQEVIKYRESWAASPFPPVFVAVDAIIEQDEKILLIRRKSEYGNGLLAMPGGYIDTKETVLQSCYRELEEETSVVLCDLELKRTKMFDAPFRSRRGRMITHVHHFKPLNPLFPKAGDDAGEVVWMNRKEIIANRSNFFADHFHILFNMLQLG